jgi:hypothetical protein
VAVEKRKPGEEQKVGPSIDELVAREKVDELAYMTWDEQSGAGADSASPVAVIADADQLPTTSDIGVCPLVTDDEERERMVYFHATVDAADNKLGGKPVAVGLAKDKLVLVDPVTHEILVRREPPGCSGGPGCLLAN